MARRQPPPTTPPKPTASRNRIISAKQSTTHPLPPALSPGDDQGKYDEAEDDTNNKSGRNDTTTPPKRQMSKQYRPQQNRQLSSSTLNLTHDTRLNAYDQHDDNDSDLPATMRIHSGVEMDMDMDIHRHTPTSFSPSKARAQAKQTHQLTMVKQWMTSLLADQDQDRGQNRSRNQDPFLLPSSSITTPVQPLMSKHPAQPQLQHKIQSEAQTQPNQHDQRRQRERTLNLISKWEAEYISLLQTNPTLAQGTFQSLQDLMFANQASDETRRLLHDAREEELALLTRAGTVKCDDQSSSSSPSPSPSAQLLAEIKKHLSPRASEDLNSLTESAVRLGITRGSLLPSTSTSTSRSMVMQTLAQPLMNATARAQNLQTDVSELENVVARLDMHLQQVRDQVVEHESSKAARDQKAGVLQGQTAQWQRETRQIQIKIQEYQERIAVLERTRPGTQGNECVRVEQVVDMQNRVGERRKAVEMLEERIRAFGGLPADLDASRAEVKRARRELADLKQKRESLFEAIVG